jgi:hypothetical protein
MIENNVSDNSIYVRNEPASIKISCPSDHDRDVNIHNTLDIELFDQKGNNILFDIRGTHLNKRYLLASIILILSLIRTLSKC